MKTLIAYTSKYGCTEKCAKILSEKLPGETDLINLEGERPVDLSAYDRIIIGGSIYMGRVQKPVTDFCNKNLDQLKGKKLGLFICCMSEGKDAEAQLNNAFPKELLDIAIAKDYFGGEFIFKKMNPLHRLIVKKIAKTDKDISKISHERIANFGQLWGQA
jgi:menaquinone-dependent protoporphyrinogen oxidase